jgi:hypothetical protein
MFERSFTAPVSLKSVKMRYKKNFGLTAVLKSISSSNQELPPLSTKISRLCDNQRQKHDIRYFHQSPFLKSLSASHRAQEEIDQVTRGLAYSSVWMPYWPCQRGMPELKFAPEFRPILE